MAQAADNHADAEEKALLKKVEEVERRFAENDIKKKDLAFYSQQNAEGVATVYAECMALKQMLEAHAKVLTMLSEDYNRRVLATREKKKSIIILPN